MLFRQPYLQQQGIQRAVVGMAAELGIETLSEADKDLMLKEWGAK